MSRQINWLDVTQDQEESTRRRQSANNWANYTWAGDGAWRAMRLGIEEDPVYAMPEPERARAANRNPITYGEVGGGTRRLSPAEEQKATPGEIFSRAVGVAFQMLNPALAGAPKAMQQTLGSAAADFTRGAVYGLPQTIADVGGSLIDIFSGNTGRNQSYALAGNRPKDYNDAESVAATVGQFAPDIAMAIGTFGVSTPLMAAAAARKGAIGAIGRAAMGPANAAPKAITAFGRAISPAATRATRVAATLAGAVPTATNVLPEVTAGRMSPVEGGLMTAFGGLGGTFAAGQWGGSRLANVLSDMGVNIAAQGASEAVTLLPGGAQFDAAQAWKNMLYGAGLGAAFGVMNARPIEGPGQRAVLGRPVQEPVAMPQPTAQTTPVGSMGGANKVVEMARNSEAILYGEPRLPLDATIEQAAQVVDAMRQASPAEFRTLTPDENGTIRSVSDAYLRDETEQAFPGMPKSSIVQAADIERRAYANSLAGEFADRPEALARVLDLEVAPGEITPENAQQVLAAKINNEWLLQASNGKGIAAVEQRLQQAGLRQAPQAQSPGPAAIVPEGAGPIQAPASTVLGQTPLLPERATPAQNAAIIPSAESQIRQGLGGYMPPLQTAENLMTLERLGRGESPIIQLPESSVPIDGAIAGEPLPPEVVQPRAAGPVEQIQMDFGPEVVDALAQARMTSDLTGLPIEEIVPAGSPVLDANRAFEEAIAAEQPVAEAPAVTEEPGVIATPEKAKRKRIARVAAKTETDAEIMTALAEATDTKTYSTATAVASTDPRDAAANVVGQKIASLAERLHLLKTESRQQGRTAVEQLQALAKILRGNGAEVTIRQPKSGGRANSIEQMLADLSGMQLREFRQAVADGQRDFAGGAVRVEPNESFSMRPAQPWEGVNDAAKIDRKYLASLEKKYKLNLPKPEAQAAEPYGTQANASRVLEEAARLSKDDKELSTVLASSSGLVNEQRVAYNVANNPNVSDATFDAAINNPAFRSTITDDVVQRMVDARKGIPAPERQSPPGPPGYKIKPTEGGFKLASEDGSLVVLARKPRGPQLLDPEGYKPMVFKTEAEARAYMQKKKLREDTGVAPAPAPVQAAAPRPVAPTTSYTVTFPEKNILNVVEDAYLAARDGATPAVKENVAARRDAKSKADRLFGSSEEINDLFAEQTSLSTLYRDVPEGVTFEAREAFTRNEDGQIIDGPEFVDERTDLEFLKGQWRAKFTSTLRSATDEVIQTIKQSKRWDGSDLTPVDVKNQLLSITAPGRWQEMGTRYLDRTVTNPDKRAKLSELVNTAITKLYNQAAGKRTVIDRLMDTAQDVPDVYFDKMYDRYTPKFEEANEYAARIADKLGLEDARELWRYIEWQKAGKRPAAKRKLLDDWQEKTMETVAFDDARATDIAAKLDPLIKEDADVNYSYEQLSKYINDQKGAEAFQNILDYNLSGGRKKPELTLRDLPTIRMSGGMAVLYALDDYVEDIKDDETYFGIPGSTIKTFLGDGNTMSYAMAGMFGVGLKSNMKHGQRNGFRARTGNMLRKAATSISRVGGQHRAVSRLPVERQNALADNFMVKNYPSIKPGTPDYDLIKAQYLSNQRYADLAGGKITDIVNKLTGNTGAGTVGLMAKFFSDIKNLGMRSQFMQDYVTTPYVRLQSQIRMLSKTVEDPINAVLPGLVSRHGDNPKFWDAIWIGADYRMSEVQLGENFEMSPTALREARNEVMDEIKRDYFSTQVEPGKFIVDNAGWEDFMAFQKAVDTLRGEDLRGLVSRSLGINSWEIDSHYGELKLSRDATQEAFGAAREARDTYKAQLDQLTGQFEKIKKDQGLEAALQMIPGYKEMRQEIKRSVGQEQANVNRLGKELQRIENRMGRIETMDSMIEKSMANMYMYRHRDGKSPLVLRLHFDESTGLPSVRREYTSIEDAELGEVEYLRIAAWKKMQDMPEYTKYAEKRAALQEELARLNESSDASQAIDDRIIEINKELDQLDGYKPLSEMTDAEVMRFAQTYEMLGPGKTIRDMRGRIAARLGTKRANLIIDQIIAAADPVKAQILSRTVDSGSITPRYIKGKGNAALVDTSSPDVVMYSGKDAPSVDELVDAIVAQVDTPIDTRQLRDLIERNYTYRDSATSPNGVTSETIWVDMTAMRNAVEAYMDPYVPNLTRRNNWTGYYDPESNWTPEQKMAYTVQSLESMIGRIKNYNQHTALRRTVADAMDWLNKWDINNGLREYIGGMAHFNEPMFTEGTLATLDQATASFSRYVSQGTLFLNMSSALGNRIQGASIAAAHGAQNLLTRHGVRRTNPDGSPGQVEWMPSQAAADAYIAAQQAKGDGSYRRVEGFKWQGLVNPTNYGIGVAAMVAPETTLRRLAVRDGWGKAAPSQQGYWAVVYESMRKANLRQGGIVGSYAVKEGVETGTWSQRVSKMASLLTDQVERANNATSILMAAADGQTRFGMTNADWRALNLGQRTEAIDQIMKPHSERSAQSSAARGLIEDEIQRLRQALPTATPAEAAGYQKQIDIKLERLAKLGDDNSALFNSLTDYLVYNRGYDQGNWDMMSKSKFERFILSAPGGRLAMTMTAPILRSMNSWQGLFRRAGATEGGRMAKLGRAAAPLMGASILTTLLGGAASTAVGLGGVFISDMAHLAEYLYHYITEEDGEKLDKIAPRQVWEKLAEDMAPRYGMDPKKAKEYVRMFWSEGMIRYYGDINISAGAGIFDITAGGTPAQVVPANAKAAWDAVVGVAGAFSQSTTPYDFLWGISNALPTSGKRLMQTGLVTLTPAALGGQGAVKVDKNGNPIIDAFTGQPQALSGWDLTKQTLFGKPWKDTRTMLVSREGGTPLYTPNDRAAWANHLSRGTKYLNFGKEGGKREALNAARFEQDAEDLQRLITAKYRGYKGMLDDGKNYVLEMYQRNENIDLGNGTTIPFRQMLAETATSGIIPETELKGRNAQSMRDKLVSDMDDWARARSAYDAIELYYGPDNGSSLSDAVDAASTPEKFALLRLGNAYRKAYRSGLIRRTAREMMR